METATAPGNQTSEYQVTKFAGIVAVLATVVGYASTLLDYLPATLQWVGPVTTIVGLLSTVLVSLGYQQARKAVKVAAIAASAVPVNTPEVAAANLAK